MKPLKIEKFGNIDDNDFSGAHDPSNAPDEFAFTYGDNKFIVTPEIDMVPSTTVRVLVFLSLSVCVCEREREIELNVPKKTHHIMVYSKTFSFVFIV